MNCFHRFHIGIISLVVLCSLIAMCSASMAETDVTGGVRLIKSALTYDRRAKTNFFNVSLQNASQDVLLTPIKVVIESTSDPSIMVVNADGVTPEGKPYFSYTTMTGELQPTETTEAKKWTLSNPNALRFTYRFSVLANLKPVAEAGPDQTVYADDTVQLDGSESYRYDLYETLLTYIWSFVSMPSGSLAALSDPLSVSPSFTADKLGYYVVQLIVNDGTFDSLPDTVTISTVNSKPVANAGSDQTVYAGNTVMLDGSKSSDVDGDLLSYRWSFALMPSGSFAALSDPLSVKPSFIVDKPGTYVVQLIVNDGQLDSLPSTVTITTANTRPVADAGAGQTVYVGNTVQLDGSKSSDTNGDFLTFRWSFTSAPAGSVAMLSYPSIENPTFTVDLPGTYIVQLIVNDGQLDSLPATVNITTANSRSVADAGHDQTVYAGDTVQLDGSASYDPDKDPLTFFWSIISKPDQSASYLNSLISVNPTFTPDLAGLYVAQLIVNDGKIDSNPNTTTITANILVLNPAPSITVIDPAQAIVGTQGMDVTISGTGFMNNTVIYVNGSERSYTPISSTQLQLTLTAQDLKTSGQIEIKAYNQPPGGGYSNSVELTVTEQIEIEITAPVDGSTINGSELMVKGYITNVTGNETGVNVNGTIAQLSNNEFSVNHVPLTEGANTITVTAKDTAGAEATKSITVNAVPVANYISISANPGSAAAPMEVFLRINGSFTISNPVITINGPGVVEQLQSNDPDEYAYRINTDGIYYFTAQAIGPDGNTYQDTISITALNLVRIDNLLRAKWAAFLDAMQQKNTEAALNIMLPYSRDKYQIMFDLLKDQLPDIVSAYVGLELESIQENRAWYELTAMENGSLSAYRVGFMQDANGLWYIREF